MPLTKKEYVQIAVIAIFLIFGIFRLATLKNRNKNAESTSPIQNIAAAVNILSTNANPPADTAPDRASQLSHAKQRWGRDPFFGLPIEDNAFQDSSSNPPSDNLVLSGISLKGNRAMAIVNRTVVREGDDVFGMKVLAIERDRVVFAKNNNEVILRIGTSQ